MSNKGSLVVTENSLLEQFLGINFLHFALFLFLFCAAVLMVVSKMGQPQPPNTLELVTFQKRTTRFPAQFSIDGIMTIILIVLVLLIWLLFSSWGIVR